LSLKSSLAASSEEVAETQADVLSFSVCRRRMFSFLCRLTVSFFLFFPFPY
jgi:hypothetical protein